VLRRALRPHFVAGLDPPANYSVRLAAADETHRRGAGFHFLYRGSSPVVRTRDPQRLAAGLCQHLAAFLPATTEGRLTVNAVALVGERGALIAPAPLRQWMSAIERRLNGRGLRVVDAPWVLLDADTNEVVVPDPVAAGLAVDPAAFGALDDLAPSSRIDPPVASGRYPLVGWAFTGDGNAMSRAQGVAFALRLTSNGAGLQPTLDALAQVMRATPPVSVEWAEPAKLAARLAAVSV
jgi:hypothetical protein